MDTTDDETYRRRPSFYDAEHCFRKVRKGQIKGNIYALYIRYKLQTVYYTIGLNVEKRCGIVLFIGLLILSLSSLGLRLAKIDKLAENLLESPSGQVAEQRKYAESYLPKTAAVSSVYLLQKVRHQSNSYNKQALLNHMNALMKIINGKINLYNVNWSFDDLCYKPELYNGGERDENNMINRFIEQLTPCSIMSVLSCFWEGANLSGSSSVFYPDFLKDILDLPDEVSWKNFNASKLFETLSKLPRAYSYKYDRLLSAMNQLGVGSGYLNKPCLDPSDPLCPNATLVKEPVEFCTGIAKNYMKWPKEMIINSNENNGIRALQSIVHMMSAEQLFDKHKATIKTQNVSPWTKKEAGEILIKWQEKMKSIFQQNVSPQNDEFYALTQNDLQSTIDDFSKLPLRLILAAYGMLVIYLCLVYSDWYKKRAFLQVTLAIFTLFIIVLSSIAALGFCCLIGLKINVLTIQFTPFILVVANFQQIIDILDMYTYHNYGERQNNVISTIMKRCSFDLVMPIIINIIWLLIIYSIFDLIAIRTFILQICIVLLVNLITFTVIIPALLAFHLNMNLNENSCCAIIPDPQPIIRLEFTIKFYESFLKTRNIQIILIILLITSLAGATLGIIRLNVSLSTSQFAIKNSSTEKALKLQQNAFPIYNLHVIAKDFDYTSSYNQKLLIKLNDELYNKTHHIGQNFFWLKQFQNWLKFLQKQFDNQRQLFKSSLNKSNRNFPVWRINMTSDAILAFKLLGQTKDGFKTRKVFKSKLIQNDGTVNSRIFYKLLSAWTSTNLLGYSYSEAQFRPKPSQLLNDDSENTVIPISKPLQFSQMPINIKIPANKFMETTRILKEITEKYTNLGIECFVVGDLISYTDTLVNLKPKTLIALGSCLLVWFFLSFIASMQFNFASFSTAAILVVYAQLIGFFGILQLHLNGIFAFLLLLSFLFISPSVMRFFTIFVTTFGTRKERFSCFLYNFLPVFLRSSIGILLFLLVVAFTIYKFIFNYFFLMSILLVGLTMANLILVLSVILYYLGPSSIIENMENLDEFLSELQTVEIVEKKVNKKPKLKNLSTITEEDYSKSQDDVCDSRVLVNEEIIPITKNTKENQTTVIKAKMRLVVEIHNNGAKNNDESFV